MVLHTFHGLNKREEKDDEEEDEEVDEKHDVQFQCTHLNHDDVSRYYAMLCVCNTLQFFLPFTYRCTVYNTLCATKHFLHIHIINE